MGHVSGHSVPCRIWDEKARPHMVACLPLTGGVVGLVWAAMAWLLQRLGCAAPLRAVLLAAAPWLVTGFLHLDGYMDVCDALLSRRDLTTRQKILKDSHCGAFAVICMVLLAACQCALFAGAPWLRLLPLGALPVASRACASVAVQRLRPMGTSQYAAMQRGTGLQLVFPLVCLLAACVVPPVLCGAARACAACCGGGLLPCRLRGFRQLDGWSGDISGFGLTLGELAGAAVLCLVR